MQNMEESFSRFDDKTTHRYFVITHVDHCSVIKTSYIPYKFAKIEKYSRIPKDRLERDVSLDLYERMRAGAKKSEFIPYECYLFIMNH